MGCPLFHGVSRTRRDAPDAVEVLLHIGSMPSPVAIAPVLGPAKLVTRWRCMGFPLLHGVAKTRCLIHLRIRRSLPASLYQPIKACPLAKRLYPAVRDVVKVEVRILFGCYVVHGLRKRLPEGEYRSPQEVLSALRRGR